MSQLVTVASLMGKFRLLGDYLMLDADYNGDATRAPADSTVIGWLDWANKRLWNTLTDTDEDYALTRTVLSASPLSGSYGLPSDFYKLRCVEVSNQGNGFSTGWTPLRRATPDDDRWSQGTSPGPVPGTGYPIAYRCFGDGAGNDVLELLPVPTSGLSVRVSYTPVAPTLTASTQSIDARNGYDECVVLRALLYSRAREGQPSTDFQEMLNDAWREMAQSVKLRDRASPHRLRPHGSVRRNWARGGYRG